VPETCPACPNPPAIGPWCAKCCPSSRKRVVATVGLPPDPVMPPPGRYRVREWRDALPTPIDTQEAA
jgi:hypothetical protein